VIRNTPKVTGFLGSSGGRTKPVPLPQEEINQILLKVGILEKPTFKHALGDRVEIIGGPFTGQVGDVVSFDNQKETAVISIDIFGRGTPTEVSFDQVGATISKK
jgi:transcriptional antiterminator NusG